MFFQVESVFSTSHITSERMRFHYMLQQLPQETITTALDIIKNQANLPDPYTRLKNKLTHTFGKTKYQMCNELLVRVSPACLCPTCWHFSPTEIYQVPCSCVCFYADCPTLCTASSKLAAMKPLRRWREPLTTCGRMPPESMPLSSLAAADATTLLPPNPLAATETSANARHHRVDASSRTTPAATGSAHTPGPLAG